MADTLVVYYSRSGVTERVARELAGRLAADLDVIRPQADYAGAKGFQRGVWHSVLGLAPKVVHDRDTADYRLVILGSPIWAGKPAAPMRRYLKANCGRFKALAAFCVSGSGQPYDGAFRAIERLSGRPLTAKIALAERDVQGEAFGSALAPFLAALRSVERPAA